MSKKKFGQKHLIILLLISKRRSLKKYNMRFWSNINKNKTTFRKQHTNKKQVAELRELNINNQSGNEELEQNGKRLCWRIADVPTIKYESGDDVLEFAKSLFKEAKVAVPDNVLDRAHRIGPSYMDRITSEKWKSIIVRFTTFRHRTLFYRTRKKFKKRI